MKTPNVSNRWLGLWDLRRQPFSLGGVLILVEELLVQAEISGGCAAGVGFVGSWPGLLDRRHDATGRSLGMAPVGGETSAVLSALKSVEGVDSLFLADELDSVRAFLAAHHDWRVWPSPDSVDQEGRLDHPFGRTLLLQQYFSKTRALPSLNMKASAIRWALSFLRKHVLPRRPVVVHLKNNPAEPGASNANSEEWFTFLRDVGQRDDVRVVLIGNEPIDDRILGLPNVLATQRHGGGLAADMALIKAAYAFMGMASGPCAMAMFSSVPYAIYKNPLHHAEEMMQELGVADFFLFAHPCQRIVRAYETSAVLLADFERLLSVEHQWVWERRLSELERIA